MHSNVKMSQTRKNKQKNIQDIKEQMKILGSKKNPKKTTAVFFHTLYAVIYESPASAMCLRLDVLFFLLDENTVNKVLLLPRFGHNSTGLCPHPLFVVLILLNTMITAHHTVCINNSTTL